MAGNVRAHYEMATKGLGAPSGGKYAKGGRVTKDGKGGAVRMAAQKAGAKVTKARV